MEVWQAILLWVVASFIFGMIIGKILKMVDEPPKRERRKEVSRL